MDFPKNTPPKVPAISVKTSGSAPRAALPQARAAATQFIAAGEERRRTQRVLLRVRARIHVALKGTLTTFDVTTLSVNAQGTLIVVNKSLPANTPMVLEHCATGEKVACKVARPPRETPEGFHTAVEFDSSAPDFWKIAFPPSDWRPDDL